jgi:membrane-bound lytic murein transglycosylase F
MTKLFGLLLAIALLGAGASCKDSNHIALPEEPQVKIDLDDIVKRGYITALVDNNSFSYFIYKGHPMGYEYELLRLLAKQLKVGLKIKVTSGVEHAHFYTYQVLVQRKPENWRHLSLEEINSKLIRDPADLVGKNVHVIKGTSHEVRIKNLSEELGGDIHIQEDTLSLESESLIRKVALGEIELTVADHTMARINEAYYPNLDINTVLSLPQQIAWAVRKNSPELEGVINTWLSEIKSRPTFMVIYNRYFKSPRTSVTHLQSDYSSLGGNKLSRYDELIQSNAKKLDWDWRLLASVVYQESKFMPDGESWAGARGLMQLMPATAKRFGASDLNDPRQSMKAGVNYLKYLEKYWMNRIADEKERLKFVLASYNAGLAHILDARKLCRKYGKNEALWEDVEYFLLKKSEPEYYRDPLVVAGYCKCEEPVNYVREVLERYEEYKVHIRLLPFDEQAVESSKTAR